MVKLALSRRRFGLRRLGGLLRPRPLAVALLEAGDSAAAVEDLLLAGVEGVALGADLNHDVAALLGASGLERITAAADHGGLDVGGMNAGLHGVLCE